MCDIAAEAILLQCWRRSGFIDHTVNKTATDLSLLPKKMDLLRLFSKIVHSIVCFIWAFLIYKTCKFSTLQKNII